MTQVHPRSLWIIHYSLIVYLVYRLVSYTYICNRTYTRAAIYLLLFVLVLVSWVFDTEQNTALLLICPPTSGTARCRYLTFSRRVRSDLHKQPARQA